MAKQTHPSLPFPILPSLPLVDIFIWAFGFAGEVNLEAEIREEAGTGSGGTNNSFKEESTRNRAALCHNTTEGQ